MAYDTPRAVPPQTIGFLLLDQFTLISLASAVEPLRMANQLTGQELYRWHTFTLGERRCGPATACRSRRIRRSMTHCCSIP